jgi:hypothetical protein
MQFHVTLRNDGFAATRQYDGRKETLHSDTGGFLTVLRHGDDVFSELEGLMAKEAVPSALFVGVGFASAATFASSNSKQMPISPVRVEQKLIKERAHRRVSREI